MSSSYGKVQLKIIPGSALDKAIQTKKKLKIKKGSDLDKALKKKKPMKIKVKKGSDLEKALKKKKQKKESKPEAPKVVTEAPENLYMYYDPRTKAEFAKDERVAKNTRFIFGTDVRIGLIDMLEKGDIRDGSTFLGSVSDKIKTYEETIRQYLKGGAPPPFDPTPYSQKKPDHPTRQEMRNLIDEYEELKKLKKNYLDTFEKRKATVPLLKYKKEIVNKKAEYVLVESSKVSVPQGFKRIKLNSEQLRRFKGKTNPQTRNVTVSSLKFASGFNPKLYRTPEEAKKHFF